MARAGGEHTAGPLRAFSSVQKPLILSDVISRALLAFSTSLYGVVVLSLGVGKKTLPWLVYTGLCEQISTTIMAAATVLIATSGVLPTTAEVLRRRSERQPGMSPGQGSIQSQKLAESSVQAVPISTAEAATRRARPYMSAKR